MSAIFGINTMHFILCPYYMEMSLYVVVVVRSTGIDLYVVHIFRCLLAHTMIVRSFTASVSWSRQPKKQLECQNSGLHTPKGTCQNSVWVMPDPD
jgi:hypothetical protein